MLIEFSVSNFRSIREKQTFSMVPGGARSLDRVTIDVPGFSGTPRVLRSAAIFGPNASGKSSLVLALAFVRKFVVESAQKGQDGDEIDFDSNSAIDGYPHTNSEFDVVFIAGGVRYQYGFSANRHHVAEEWMYVTRQNGRVRRLFQRSRSQHDGLYEYYFAPDLKAESIAWIKVARENALILSVAVQMNSDDLKIPFRWFRNKLRVITASDRVSPSYTANIYEKYKGAILSFLRIVDPSINSISISERPFMDGFGELPNNLKKFLVDDLRDQGLNLGELKIKDTFLGHSFDGREIYIPLKQESGGVQVLFSLIGPIIDVFLKNRVLVMDELNNSMHPIIVMMMAKLFNGIGEESRCQVIFTSHDPSIMGGDGMHRDQIWFVDRIPGEGSLVFPMSEFAPRREEVYSKSYLQGRYGGVPTGYELHLEKFVSDLRSLVASD